MGDESSRKHSWKASGNIAEKKTDKSFYDHRGTVIPQDIVNFFSCESLKLKEKKYISLLFEGEEYWGRITRGPRPNLTRLFWSAWLGEKFDMIFNLEKNKIETSPYAIFEKISDKKYEVFLEDDSVIEKMGMHGKYSKNNELPARSQNNEELSHSDSEPTEEEIGEVIFGVHNKFIKKPRTLEEANAILKQISEKMANKPIKEKRKMGYALSRDQTLSTLVKIRDNYICQICGTPGFKKKNGGLYAEAHHMFELAKTLRDDPDEMICVCPMCHRVIHYGTNEEIEGRRKSK